MFKGKAGSLRFLKSLHLNVPDFIIITHNDFVSWGDISLLKKLEETLNKQSAEDVKKAAKLFVDSVSIPDLKLSENKFYAVRSSALLEDSPEHSFAGIFESVLYSNDISFDIKEVWLSLFSDKALHYCTDKNISWTQLKMDIVIQEMISGEKSGVLFQANPLGDISEQIIIAGFGLGQGIVDEISDSDRYIVKYGEIRKEIQNKELFLCYENGTLIRKAVSPEQRTIPVLNDAELNDLLDISVIIAKNSSYFMDIEFTFSKNKLYILQARPITTVPSRKNILIFDNSNIAENYPGQSTPLTFTALQRGYAKNFKNLFRFIGLPEEEWSHLNNQIDQLVGYWGGQIYYNLNNWYAIYGLLPYGGDKAVASFNEMVGINSESSVKIPERTFQKKLRIALKILPRFISFYVNGEDYHLSYKKEFETLYKKYSRKIDEAESSLELIEIINQLDHDYLSIIKIPLFNDFYSSLLNYSCKRLAGSLDPEKGEQYYNDLLSNREELESSRAIYSILELSEIVSKNSSLMNYLEKSTVPCEEYQYFFDKLEAHFNRFGDRSQWEMKIEVPTAREIPETTIRLILEYANSGITAESQKQKERIKSENARKALESISGFPLRSRLFWMLFRKTTEAIAFREDSRFDRVRFKGLSRKLLLKLGSCLTQKHWINSREDLFYLTIDEIMSLSHDSYGPEYWKELIALRKKHLGACQNLKLPDRIMTNDIVPLSIFEHKSDINSSSSLKGIPCSGGVVEAQCEVVLDLNKAPALTGKILVAERTDPAWGYFFVGVKGIIIEKGSMLSHAAIISRELGIPCIINVKDATQILKSGMKIRMNGDTGEIEIN